MLHLGLGIFAIGYGLYTFVQRVRKPEAFKKIEPMKERFGPQLGYALHVFFYSIVPIGFGCAQLLEFAVTR